MKRKITALLALAMVFSMLLASCDKTNTPSPSDTPDSSSDIYMSNGDLSHSPYEGWIEIDNVRYSIGDTVDKFTQNGWETFSNTDGSTPYDEVVTPEDLSIGMVNFKKGDSTIVVVPNTEYVKESTPVSKLMIECIYVVSSSIGWVTDTGATNETPFSELSSYYSGEYTGSEYSVHFAIDENHPWSAIYFEERADDFIDIYVIFDLSTYMGD